MLILWQKNNFLQKKNDFEYFAFNNLILNNKNYIVTSFSKTPALELSTFNLPLNSWKWFISSFSRWWSLSLNIIVKWENKEDFMKKIDNLYKEIFKDNLVLISNINWVFRKNRVFCTSAPLDFSHFNTYFVSLVLNFEYLSFFEDFELHTFDFINKVWNFWKEIENLWNAPSIFDFYLIFKENTNLTKIKIKNNEDEFFEIEKNFKSWDILKIFWDEIQVFKNKELIDFEWNIFSFKPWINFLNFEFEWEVALDCFILAPKKFF